MMSVYQNVCSLGGVDGDTAALIVKLETTDAEELCQSPRGRFRSGALK